MPGGGATLGLTGARLVFGLAGNVVLGVLMMLGIGLYAPCMILVSLLGMNPTAAFPIMMANLVNYLSPPGVVQSSEIQTGSPESLSPLPQVQSVRVTGPNDQAAEFRTGQGPITYAATDVPGLYRVQQLVQGGQQTVDDDLFAANLANPDESDIRPRLTGLDSPGLLDAGVTTLQKEFWGVLAALVLPLMLFEWFWFHRRT